MKSTQRSFLRVLAGFTFRSTVVHTVTYMIIGALAFQFMTHRYDEATPGIQDLHGPHVMHWFFLAQIVRGILHGLVLFPLRRALLDMKRWGGLVVGSILFMVGSVIGIGGAIEMWVYTTGFNPTIFLVHLPEVVIQTILFGYLLLAWERRVEKKYEVGKMPPNADAHEPPPSHVYG
jgi:hypothetical protein